MLVSAKKQPNAISAPAEYEIRCRLRARRIGKRIGLAEGRREGRSKSLLAAARSIMEKLGLNLDEALNALSIPKMNASISSTPSITAYASN